MLYKCIEHIGNRSIGEIFVKLLTDCVLKVKSPPGVEKKEDKHENVQELLLALVEFKLDEDADPLEKLGVLETLADLIPACKVAYVSFTTKEAFELLTKLLVSEDADCERHCYNLLRLLIANYERYERF